MSGFRFVIALVLGLTLTLCQVNEATAQIYGGIYYAPGRHHSGFYAGTYIPGSYVGAGYYGYPYVPYTYGVGYGVGPYGLAYPYTLGYPYGVPYSYSVGTQYTRSNVYNSGVATSTYNKQGSEFYGVGNLGYSSSYGQPGYGSTSPVVANPNPNYVTSTTIVRSGPTGGVMQYTAKGDGYTYVPDSTYPTLIQNQPTLGLSRMYVPPTSKPTVIESRPQSAGSNGSLLTGPQLSSSSNYGSIKISLPASAPNAFTYSLNGHLFTIKPGYSQVFREDRPWTIEFKRDATSPGTVQYPLKAGNYVFAQGAQGWDLQQPDAPANTLLPPAPLSDTVPTPLPDLSPVPTGNPTAPPTPSPSTSVPPSPMPPP